MIRGHRQAAKAPPTTKPMNSRLGDHYQVSRSALPHLATARTTYQPKNRPAGKIGSHLRHSPCPLADQGRLVAATRQNVMALARCLIGRRQCR